MAIACALAVSVGCESIDIPPVSRDNPPGQQGLSFEPSSNSTIDAYDLIVYNRIERKWHDLLDALSSLYQDYHQNFPRESSQSVNKHHTVVC
jgi:hypothetical protein